VGKKPRASLKGMRRGGNRGEKKKVIDGEDVFGQKRVQREKRREIGKLTGPELKKKKKIPKEAVEGVARPIYSRKKAGQVGGENTAGPGPE